MPSQMALESTITVDARCPRCNTLLATIQQPCPNCGLGFVQRNVACAKCSEPLGSHILRCPVLRAIVPCPLCGGLRHRKASRYYTKAQSIRDCLWRQWARDEGLVDVQDSTDLGPEESSDTLAAFNSWRRQHPNQLAGSTDAERVLRQTARAATTPVVFRRRPEGRLRPT